MTKAYFSPYVEARAIAPTKPGPTESGSNTVDIDAYRQGVEVIAATDRHIGMLPTIGTGDQNHELDICTFGQPNEFVFDSYFEEIGKFSATAIILNSSSLTYPVVLDSPAYESPEYAGGFIQPLSIPSRDSLLSTSEFEAHDIRASIMLGNETCFKSVDVITSRLSLSEEAQVHDLYIDAADNFGYMSGSIQIQGIFPESEKTLKPFSEARYLSRSVISGSTLSNDIKAALTSRSIDSEVFIDDGYRISCTGFTYENCYYGVDSLAFGGLKRS